MKVLVIDDEPNMREVVADCLSVMCGCDVVSAKDGQDGIQVNDIEQPDVMLLDMMMPGQNGFAVLQEISGASHHRPARVIAMSGLTDGVTVDRIMALGADSVLPKPFTLQELRTACVGQVV